MLARLLALLGAALTVAVLVVPPLLDAPLGSDAVAWASLAGFAVAVSAVGFGWTRLLRVPTGWGVGMIVALTGVAGGLLVTLDGDDGLRWVPPALAIGVVVAFVHQMGRRDGRPRLVESVSATVVGQAVVLLGTGWLVPGSSTGSAAPALVSGVGCTAALLVMTTPWPRRLALPLASLGAALVGGALAGTLDGVGVVSGLLTSAVAGTASASVHVLMFRQPTASYRRAAVATGVAAVLAAGLAVHVGARLTLG